MREGGGRRKYMGGVLELERLAKIAAAHQTHRCLQIVAGFTGHTHYRKFESKPNEITARY